jgi:hypothetical protein
VVSCAAPLREVLEVQYLYVTRMTFLDLSKGGKRGVWQRISSRVTGFPQWQVGLVCRRMTRACIFSSLLRSMLTGARSAGNQAGIAPDDLAASGR